MRRSSRLRAGELKSIHDLVVECLEVGHDSDAWHRHAMEGLYRLVGARSVSGGEGWVLEGNCLVPAQAIAVGMPAVALQSFEHYVRQDGPATDPVFQSLVGQAARPLLCRTRRQLVDDRTYYGSLAYNAYRRPGGVDDCLYSLLRWGVGGGGSGAPGVKVDMIGVQREPGDPPFTEHDQRLVRLAHLLLSERVGTRLATLEWPPASRLPSRQRQTLDGLLAGLSEKEIAARLGLRVQSVHDHVKRLYATFGVGSRGELLAYFLTWTRGKPPQVPAGRRETRPAAGGRQRGANGPP